MGNDKVEQAKPTNDGGKDNAWQGVSQQIIADEMRDFFLNNFKKLDADGNGGVSKNEIQSVDPNQFGDRDKQSLQRIQNNYDTLVKMTSGRGSWQTNGTIIPADMTMFSQYHNTLKHERDAIKQSTDFIRSNFYDLDTDKNGFVSMTEMQNSGKLAQMPHAASNYYRMIKASNDEWGFERKGISKNDLDKYESKWNAEKNWNHDKGRICGCPMCTAILNIGFPTKGDVLRAGE